MKVSLILAHPGSGSFNHAIAKVAGKTLQSCGHQVAFHDLCLERFDPILRYEEISKSAAVDIVVQESHRFSTSNTFPEREHQVFDDPLETLWRKCLLFEPDGIHRSLGS